MAAKPTHVIVGASLAGAKAAEALREEGFDGRIVLIGAEYEPPYERPALSKDFIRAESEREKLLVHDSDFYSQHHIELRTSTTVEEIDPEATEVVLAGGERLGYDRLLLTTGAAPRRLAVPGSDLEGVLYLRELGDAERIREGIARGGRLVVIGAGWIGAEVAASAREKGLEVTIVEQGAVPLERVLGPRIGEVYAYIHRDHGTQLVTGAGLEAFEGAGRVERVRLTDGRTLDCDFVVVGIGVLPRTELAERAGLEVTRGVVVDERLETSVPGVFAAGDVANHRHPVFGALHLEHWANALNQGPAAARAMLGRGGAYDRVPYFYSDQYDVGMEYSGFAGGEDEVVFRGDPAAREFVAFWLRDGRVAAGMNVNVWGVTEAIEALVRSQIPVDRGELADTSVALGDIGTQRPTAAKASSSAGQLLSQGVQFPKRFLQARFSKGEQAPVSAVSRGEAKILQIGGEKAGVYRDDEGEVHAVSPVCTHMGCLVDWNGAERTWDCPCHGSRFDPNGRVLRGPAKKDLKPQLVPETGPHAA